MPLIYEKDTYRIQGILFEVYNNLGSGFAEIVYKDAIEYELTLHQIPFEREKEYVVNYKGKPLKHKFFADFVLFGKIILEIKSCEKLDNSHKAQCINYLRVSRNKLALIANFNKNKLEYQRIIY